MNGPVHTTPSGDSSDQPAWRKSFPIDTESEAKQTRREFVGGAVAAGGIAVCGKFVSDSLLPELVSAETISFEPLTLDTNFHDLKHGEATLFHFPDHKSPCLLVRLHEEFVAFSQKCTHLACPVIPNIDEDRLDCPCHKGAFSLSTGEPLSGPPGNSLPQVVVERDSDGRLTATGIRTASGL